MLKSLESRYATYQDAHPAAYERQLAALVSEHASEGEHLAQRRQAMVEQHERVKRDLEIRRESLNVRIDQINERIRGLAGKNRELREAVEAHESAHARQSMLRMLEGEQQSAVETVRSVQSDYRAQIERVKQAFDRLEGTARQYREGADPRSAEIASDIGRIETSAKREQATLTENSDAYRREQRDFQRWLDTESARLAHAHGDLEDTARAYESARHDHDEAGQAANARIAAYNAKVEEFRAADRRRDDPEAVRVLEGIETSIAEANQRLETERARALSLGERLKTANVSVARQQEQFVAERVERVRALASQRETLARQTDAANTLIRESRDQVQARASKLGKRIEAEIEALRENLNAAQARLISGFSPQHEALHRAVGRWLGDGDGAAQLTTNDGSTEFDRTYPQVDRANVAIERSRRAHEQVAAILRDAQATGIRLKESDAELRRLHAALDEQRERVIEESRALVNEDERERRRFEGDATKLHAAHRALAAANDARRHALKRFFDARLALTASEFSSLQGLFVAAIKGSAAQSPSSSEGAELHATLLREAQTLDGRIDEAMLATHALRRSFAEPDRLAAPAGADGVDLKWTRYAYQPIRHRRKLSGNQKQRLIRSWYRLAAGEVLERQRRALSVESSSGQADAYLRGLFTTGLSENSTIVEQEFENGARGVQVRILDRVYWLDERGSLEHVPDI